MKYKRCLNILLSLENYQNNLYFFSINPDLKDNEIPFNWASMTSFNTHLILYRLYMGGGEFGDLGDGVLTHQMNFPKI